MTMTKPTSEQVTFTAAGSGATLRNLVDKMRETVSVKDFGAVGDGVADDTAAIAAAIAASKEVSFPPGDYRVTAPIAITNKVVSLYSQSTDTSDGCPVRILCYEVTGHLFALIGSNTRFSVNGLQFDGRLNGAGGLSEASTTWAGLIANPNQGSTNPSDGVYSVTIANCQVSWSRVASAAALDLRHMFLVDVRNTRISYFMFGYAMRAGTANISDTTISFYKVYMNYNRHCVRIAGQTTDVQFRSCVFESSVVAITVEITPVLFSGCYFENIGYDVSGTGISTGLIQKNFGINFGPGILTDGVASAINILYASCTFASCVFMYRQPTQFPLQPNAGWLYMCGRGSTNGSGGGAKFDNCRLALTQGVDFCEVDADAGQEFDSVTGVSVSWNDNSRVKFLRYGDIRRLKDSQLYVEFPSTGSNPTFACHCHVLNGRLIVHQPPFAVPVNSPVGGQWNVGDTIYYTSPNTQGYLGAICTVAGTPGTWTPFGELLSAPVTKTADFTLAASERLVIANKSGSACVVTLPAAASNTGRRLLIKTTQAQAVNSASSNVVPLTGGAAGTQIVSGTSGNWAEIVSDGTNWVIMSSK